MGTLYKSKKFFVGLLAIFAVVLVTGKALDADNAYALTYEIPEGYTTFTDANFYNCVAEEYHYLYESEDISSGLADEQLAKITGVDCSRGGIYNATGIEKMTSIETLNLGGNSLSYIDLSQNTKLINLYLWGNYLTSLDLSRNTNLVSLGLRHNRLTSISLFNNTKLEELDIESNSLTSLDLSKNTKLKWLWADGNDFVYIDISNNPSLEFFTVPEDTLVVTGVYPIIKDGAYVYDFSRFSMVSPYCDDDCDWWIKENEFVSYDKNTKTLTVTDIDKIGEQVYAVTVEQGWEFPPYRLKLNYPKDSEDEDVVDPEDEEDIAVPDTANIPNTGGFMKQSGSALFVLPTAPVFIALIGVVVFIKNKQKDVE